MPLEDYEGDGSEGEGEDGCRQETEDFLPPPEGSVLRDDRGMAETEDAHQPPPEEPSRPEKTQGYEEKEKEAG